MKCLIYCPSDQVGWLNDYFGGIHPYFLRVLNKPLLEYYIDFCVINQITQIRIIKNDPANEMEEYFGDGMQWGTELSYSLARREDDFSRVLLKNSGFCKNEDLLIIYGFHFLNYNQSDENLTLFKSEISGKIVSKKSALYLLRNSAEPWKTDFKKLPILKVDGISLTDLVDISTYYNLSMDILQNRSTHFVLQGYSNEPEEFVGMNVIYNPHTVSFQKPIMIGDNVRIKNNTFIGSNTVLGNNVIIDSSSNIRNSIVYDLSYVGSDLDIENKIIYRNKLINPESGSSMDIADKFFISGIDRSIFSKLMRKFIHSIFAILLIVLYALPNAVFGLLEVLGGSFPQKQEFFTNRKFKIIKLPIWSLKRPKPLTLMFMRFSLDKYPLLFSVVCGKLLLVGNRLQPADTKAMQLIISLHYYHPGVFDYPGMFSNSFGADEIEMHELYYAHHSNIGLDIKIIVNTLFGRFFNIGNYLRNKSYK